MAVRLVSVISSGQLTSSECDAVAAAVIVQFSSPLKLDWSEAYVRDIQTALGATAADFTLFQLGDKVPECPKKEH